MDTPQQVDQHFAFVLAQAWWISRYLPDDAPKPAEAPPKGEGP